MKMIKMKFTAISSVLFILILQQSISAQLSRDVIQPFMMPKNSAAIEDSNVTFLGQWAWGPCYAVEVQGDYAFMSNGGLLQVLDISNPADPQIAAELQVNGFFDIDISGPYAYLAGNHALTIIDIANPTNPAEVGNLHITAASIVTVSGSYAYVGDYPGFLHIIDVSDPTEPCKVSTQKVAGECVVGIGIYQNYAYVSTSLVGMTMDIIDISDPNNPRHEGYYFTGGGGGDIAVDGHYLYLGTSISPQFRVLDITDPVHPEYVGGLETGRPNSIKVVENLAYISQWKWHFCNRCL